MEETSREAEDGWRHGLAGLGLYFALLFLFLFAGQFIAAIFPRDPLGWFSWMITTAAALVSGWIVLAHHDGRPLAALGLPWSRSAVRDLGAGLLFGSALIGVAMLLLFATGAARFVPDAGSVGSYLATLGWTIAFFGIAAAAEELLFRGYAFQALVRLLGTWPAVVLSSAVFSWMHARNPNIGTIAFLNLFLAGVMLALAYLRTRSLWFVTAVHLGWNWVMATLLDFPVSGLSGFDTPLYSGVEVGEDWWTGGLFGPEAGAAGTLALLAGIVWLLRTDRLCEPASLRSAAPLVDRRLGPAEPRA